jgi:hypothetical protein
VAKHGLLVRMAVSLPIIPLLVGCASTRPVEGPVRLGQMAAVNGTRVRADRVIEDSRCPTDAQCVQAGRLIVQVTVFGGGWSRQFDLQPGMPVHVADGNLTLVEATPLPRTTRP